MASFSCNAQTFRPWVAPPMISPSPGQPIKIEKEQFSDGLVVHLEYDGSAKPYEIKLTRVDGEQFSVHLSALHMKDQAVLFITTPQATFSKYKLTVVRTEGWSRQVVGTARGHS
jgi:hypothetical protein